MACTTKSLFGQDLDFQEYFRKFCHRVISLPKPNEQGFRNLVSEYVNRYLDIEGKRLCGFNLRDRAKDTVELAIGLQMRPRQIQEAFRIVGHVGAVADPNHRGQVYWCIAATTILLAFLRVSRQDVYLGIMEGRMPHEEVGLFLISILGKKRAEWWFYIYLTGVTRNSDSVLDFETILQKTGFLTSGQAFAKDATLGQFYQGWGRFNSIDLPAVFHCIEAVASF